MLIHAILLNPFVLLGFVIVQIVPIENLSSNTNHAVDYSSSDSLHQKENDDESINSNFVGENCEKKIVESLDTLSSTKIESNVFLVNILQTNINEMNEYISSNQHFTKANTELAIGRVRGIPKAEIWATKNTTAWVIPPTHPRNNNKLYCLDAARKAGIGKVSLYDSKSESLRPFYLVKINHGFIHDTGIVGTACGHFQGHEGCGETIFKSLGIRWRKDCEKSYQRANMSWESMWEDPSIRFPSLENILANSSYHFCKNEGKIQYLPRRYKQVFVMTGQFDTNYHHFLVDSLVKFVRYEALLRSHPHMMIHIRGAEKNLKKSSYIQAGKRMKRDILSFLGVDLNRLVKGTVVADEVYLPRTTICNSPTAHALEIRALAKMLLFLAFKHEISIAISARKVSLADVLGLPFHGADGLFVTYILPVLKQSAESSATITIPTSHRPKLILQHRPCATTLSECLKTWREWPDESFNEVYEAFRSTYGGTHSVIAESPLANHSWMGCFHCQIREYATADIIVGVHGAGLTNLMYMKPGSMLVEIIGRFDGRMLPICGYYGPFSAIFGVHHFIYYYDWKGKKPLNPSRIARESWEFYNDLKTHSRK